MVKLHLQVFLLDFQTELWTKYVFEGLANFMGKFIKLDKNKIYMVNKIISLVMVEHGLSKELLNGIEIVWGERIIKPKLDYLHIPFWC